MWPCEDSYGTEKRLKFICNIIRKAEPKTILDVGCGVGKVTYPLANLFPEIAFFGSDSDRDSIEYARRHQVAQNLTFGHDYSEFGVELYDMVIASEVIEHVESPADFLASLHQRITNNGCLVLTLPNGYGPFEMAALGESILKLIGVYELLRLLKRSLSNKVLAAYPDPVTLAVSPHINFFSYNEITRLLTDTGFMIERYAPRTFLCGFVFDQLMRSRWLLKLNAKISDCLPTFASSGWMFLAKPNGEQGRVGIYKRGPFGRVRRYLKEMQCGIR